MKRERATIHLAILWQESRMLPDDPRQYGRYWNRAKEWEPETVEEIAD